MSMTGGCGCGEVRYEIAGDPIQAFVCHCNDCQHATGGGPAFGMLVAADGFRVTQGGTKSHRKVASSGKGISRHFCGTCGSPLYAEIELLPGVYDVSVGGLDDPGDYTPAMHMWVSAAKPWHHLDPARPHFEQNPPPP